MENKTLFIGLILTYNKKRNSYKAQYQACYNRDFLSCEIYFFNKMQCDIFSFCEDFT